MPTGIITSVASVGGLSITSTITREAAAQIGLEDALPVGKAGVLTTHATDYAGTVTLLTGHGINDGDLFMLFWGTDGMAYNCTAGTVGDAPNDLTIPFTLAVGDAVPAQDTAVIVSEQIAHDLDFDFDDVVMICARSTTRAGLVFSENDATVLKAVELTANEPFQWASDTGVTIPATGDPVGQVIIANASTTTEGAFKLGAIIDSE